MTRWLALLLLLAPSPALAQAPPWNPAADYITTGQDEPGYRSWYMALPARTMQVKAFNDYLDTYEVGGIVPTWQLLRTATSWQRCGAQPFEIPPTSDWPHIVQTLRYIRDYVVPAVGPVEPVSAYRNPYLNVCAGGAPESAHKHYSAVDLVPLRPITREGLMRTLCSAHARRGPDYGVGLGFYAFLRFHVDTTKYRRWNMDPTVASLCPAIVRPPIIAKASPPTAQPEIQAATMPTATPVPTVIETPATATPVRPVTATPVPPVIDLPAAASDPLAPSGPPAPSDPLAPQR